MTRKIREWLITRYLPEKACEALAQEAVSLRRQLDACREEADSLRQEKARLESYIHGMQRAMRGHRVDITVNGGAA